MKKNIIRVKLSFKESNHAWNIVILDNVAQKGLKTRNPYHKLNSGKKMYLALYVKEKFFKIGAIFRFTAKYLGVFYMLYFE